ncbi:Lipopolysaccharide biosynthesis protein WzxC [Klebsiella oxytoca]|uniref:oligosaccharide flippase family protein n=1 Tax=Klebsiella grimontii TaxID=2058152 RepID=UPI0012BA2AA1|nr:Lipopolysaccharide biosynthesis protein WzxC [Klebsiella oxytoca]CAH5660375.1 Lipopolysaccharide biosynthesis protein WzxC [Klebsiella oxytoca]
MANEEVSSRKIFTGFIWFIISKLFPALSGLVIFFVTSRSITAEDLGLITLSISIITFIIYLSYNGFCDAIIQIKELKQKHVDTVFFLNTISSTIFFTISVVIIFILTFFGVFPQRLNYIYIILGAKCLLDTLSLLPVALLARQMEFKAIGIRTLYSSILAALVALPVFYYFGSVASLIVNYLISSFCGFVIAWGSSPYPLRIKFDRASYIDLRHIGVTTTAAKLISSVSFDNIFIGFFGSGSTLGLYSFSKRVFGIFTDILSGGISSVTYPLYASLQDDKNKLKESFLKATFLSALVGIPAYTGLILLSPSLIPLFFGRQWIDAVPVLQISCLLGFITCIGSLQTSLIKGVGKSMWILKYQCAQQILTILIAIIFSSQGPVVVMALITIKTFLIWPFTIFYITKLLSVSVYSYLKNLFKPFISGAVLVCVFYIMKFILGTVNPYFFVVLEIFTCAVFYILSILILARHEITIMLSGLKKK